jgi:hypothetical protein
MSFPLYQSLSQDISQKDLTVAEKTDFIRQLEKFDQDGYEILYALIVAFQNEKEGVGQTVPYEGVLRDGLLEFNLLSFPIPLRHILYRFATKHTQKLDEDKKFYTFSN